MHTTTVNLERISFKPAPGRPFFPCGHKLNLIYACTVNPYAFLKTKKAAVILNYVT